jgi:hypothetical protein
MNMPSAYQNFLKSFLHPDQYERRDGTPLDLLDKLLPEEKLNAEKELLKRLDGRDDWIIEGLGHLKSKAALPKLYELLRKKWRRTIRAIIATAIWNICNDQKMLKVVLESSYYSFFAAYNPFYEYAMIDVVLCLAQFPQKEARLRLEELASNEYYLISYNAKAAINHRRNLYKIYD